MKNKLKKLLAGVIALGMMVTCLPQIVIADSGDTGTYGDFEYTELSDGTLLITGYNGDGGEVEIPSEIGGMTVTEIGNRAFFECASLISITIPDSVTLIGCAVFYGCNSLKTVNLGSGVEDMFEFGYETMTTTSIAEINIDSDNEYFASVDGVLFTKDMTTLIYYPRGKEDTEYTVPDGVICIGGYGIAAASGEGTFYNCSSIESIEIPDSVTKIAENSFGSCTSLTAINVSDENEYYTSVDGVLFTKDMTALLQYPAGKEAAEYVIPESVKSMGMAAFKGSQSLEHIDLGNVEEISFYAFESCASLTSITIPDGVTFIAWGAFDNCTSLKAAVFYGNETEIDSDVFSGCSDSLTIYGYEGSTAETYADENSIKFALISSYAPDSIDEALPGGLDGSGNVNSRGSALLAATGAALAAIFAAVAAAAVVISKKRK